MALTHQRFRCNADDAFRIKLLGIPSDRLNVKSGAIAIGHRFGMTGSRLAEYGLVAARRRGARHALVTMRVGGDQGAATLFEVR